MTIKCDHCRKQIGLTVQRYWRMQFCSADCVKAYQHRLDEVTIGKVRCLERQLSAPVNDTLQEAA